MSSFQSSNVALPNYKIPAWVGDGKLGNPGFIPTDQRDHEGKSYDYRRQQMREACYASGGGGFAELSDKYGVQLIPESEWPERIAEREEARLRWSMVAEDFGLHNIQQGQTNYCWIFAIVNAVRCLRWKQSFVNLKYCPTSAGARITGFRNVGGWSTNGLRHLLEHGVNLEDDWPLNQISRQYDTPANKEKALQHKVLEGYFIDSYNESVSLQLQDIPVAGGHNWWRHAILHTDPIMVGGRVEQEIWNSWRESWGRNGFGTLDGSKKRAEDYCAAVVLQPL